MPHLWRHLVLAPGATLEQADAWIKRSRGFLSSLRLLQGFSFENQPEVFRSAFQLADIWSKLDSLVVLNGRNGFNEMVPPSLFEQFHLQSLELSVSESTSDFEILHNMDTSRTQTLVLNIVRVTCGYYYGAPSENQFTFGNLTTLILREGFVQKDIFSLFKSNPLLETVVLDFVVPCFSNATKPIELVHLKHLEIRLCDRPYQFLKSIHFLNLETLKLDYDRDNDGWKSLIVLEEQTLKRLRSLSLRGYSYFSATLISFLRTSNALKELTLSRCKPILMDDDEKVIAALTGTARAEQDPLQKACCPLLQHLDLSGSPCLTADPIKRLVKSRLASNAARSDSEAGSLSLNEDHTLPLPILSLNIDECPMISPDAVLWLQTRVPRLSARLIPVKK